MWLSSLYLPPLIRVESLAHYREVNEFNLVKEGDVNLARETQIHW